MQTNTIPQPTPYGGEITQQRLNYLFDKFNEGGSQEAVITKKSDAHHYTTELEDIGPIYLMDDFGNAVVVSWEMWGQYFFFASYKGVLT